MHQNSDYKLCPMAHQACVSMEFTFVSTICRITSLRSHIIILRPLLFFVYFFYPKFCWLIRDWLYFVTVNSNLASTPYNCTVKLRNDKKEGKRNIEDITIVYCWFYYGMLVLQHNFSCEFTAPKIRATILLELCFFNKERCR